jgi:hypothetical protein
MARMPSPDREKPKPDEFCRRLKEETLVIGGVPIRVYRWKRRWWIAAKKGQILLTPQRPQT